MVQGVRMAVLCGFCSMVLLGTSKNAGFAAGLALTLFSREAAIPSTIQTISMLSYIIFLDLKTRRTHKP